MALDFVAIDVETANSKRGSVCEFGFAVVRAGALVAQGSWRCRPPAALDWFDRVNTTIHGIGPADVDGLPRFDERVGEIVELIGGLPVVAHNAAFDIRAIVEACAASDIEVPTLDYACTLVLARRLLNLPSNRLEFVCAELGVDLNGHHNACVDAVATARVAIALAGRVEAESISALLAAAQVRGGLLSPTRSLGSHSLRALPASVNSNLPVANPQADPSNPFFGESVVFTGALSVPRTEAWKLVAELGASPQVGVNKLTTVLVIGDGFTGDSITDFSTGKARKAESWRLKGHRIEVLNETEFWERLEDASAERHLERQLP